MLGYCEEELGLSFEGLQKQDQRAAMRSALPAIQERESFKAEITKSILKGDYSLTINPEKQARHMGATKMKGKSAFEPQITMEVLQKFVNKYAGQGEILLARGKLEWSTKEEAFFGDFTVDGTDGDISDAIHIKGFKIHYSKTGVHVVEYAGRRGQK